MKIKIRNERELNKVLKAIEEYKSQPKVFEVNKFYKWNFPKWHNGQNPPTQGGRLQCVHVDSRQSVLRNQHGLHVVANAHLSAGDIVITA